MYIQKYKGGFSMKAISLRLDEEMLKEIKKVSNIYNIPISD